MPEQAQIFAGSVEAAPKDYTVAANVELRLVAVNASFTDNGAGGDWLPAVVLISDSGHVIARAVDQAVKVTAGDDAAVSWFPGVKHSAAAGGVTGIASGIYAGSTGVGQVIPSGTVTALTFDTVFSAPGSFPPVAFTGSPAGSFTVTAWRVHVDLTVVFPAGAYDRYIELAQVGSSGSFPLFSPVRARESVSPDGDSLSVSALVGGSPFSPEPLQLNVFQASGVNKTVRRYATMTGWPIPLPSEAWS